MPYVKRAELEALAHRVETLERALQPQEEPKAPPKTAAKATTKKKEG